MSRKNLRVKADLTRADVIEYIREGLRRDNLVAEEGVATFFVNADAVNDDDILVEVANVSVATNEQETEAAPLPSPSPGGKARVRKSKEEDTNDEENEDIADLVRKHNQQIPPRTREPTPKRDPRVARVGLTLADLGKAPDDMSDEI